MRYLALAADYDGTLAHHGQISDRTLEAMRRCKDSGRKLILVTGRELPDLLRVFPTVEIFDRVVAENGALLYRPATREERPLAPAPPPRFADLLRERGVRDLSVGRVILGTYEPNETIVLQAIRELGLELHVIFNKGAVMVLPSGVNKATGLQEALQELGLSPHNVAAVGDAENDHAFLEYCECSIAVANALPSLREKADLVTKGNQGDGVAELIDHLLADDLASLAPRLTRHHIALGDGPGDVPLSVPPFGASVLVAGASGGGKSTLVTGLVERLMERKYQALIIDPEGDYDELAGAVRLGSGKQAPSVDELIGALGTASRSVVANLISIRLEDKPAYFQRLAPRLAELRTATGRPHWIVLDETHHLFPKEWEASTAYVPFEFRGLLGATVHPAHIAPAVLHAIDLLIATGPDAAATLGEFCAALGKVPPAAPTTSMEKGWALAWWRNEPSPVVFKSIPTKSTRRRHIRKYAEGELDKEASFYFEGREKRLHLRAQNLQTFMELADGVDEDTWNFHLHERHYSTWVRQRVKDDDLADAIARIEASSGTSAQESRAAVRREIEARYTAAE